jgi:DNA-binding transcriptional ArsR family regulator
VFQGLIERTRQHLDVTKLRTLFGYKSRPHQRQGKKPLRLARVLDQPAYDLTVFKVHFGPLTLKLYDKGARVLRIEAIAHNIKGLRCGKSVEKLPIMLAELQRMVIDFLNVVQAAHCSFLPDGILDTLAAPTQRGERRLAGVDMQNPRMRAVSEALLALAPKPGGFTLAELAAKVRALFPESPLDYAPRHASYDLSKLRGKALVERVDRSRRYLIPQRGIRILGGMLILREKVIKPVLSGLGKLRVGRPPKNIHPLDQHYMNLQQEMRHTLETLALAS